MSNHDAISQTIEYYRTELGPALTILGHHYMPDEVIAHVDHAGDSLELARRIPGLDSEFIVFCGVFFMAETAAILARPDQKILIPDVDASCVMSEMAPASLVEAVLTRLMERGRRVIPLTYVNSSAAVKAVCGRFGGSVCTSANAKTMLTWAMERGDGVLFLPDKNLGQNTADLLGLPERDRLILDIRSGGARLDPAACDRARLLLWPGCCAVHARFKAEHVLDVRRRDPDAKVIVHPECAPEVVKLADASGSTSRMIRYCEEAPLGASVIVGTEIRLVERLAKTWRGRKTILPLFPSLCSNMAKMAKTIEGRKNAVGVKTPEDIAAPARKALERMLEACA